MPILEKNFLNNFFLNNFIKKMPILEKKFF